MTFRIGRNRRRMTLVAVMALLLAAGASTPALALDREKTVDRLRESVEVLSEIINIPEDGIPDSLLRKAEGLVVIPNVISGAFLVGARHGYGIMVHKLPDGKWSNPCFVSISGGSFGLQIGGQAVDLVLVIQNPRGFESVLKDNFTLSGDAKVTAGPVGRNAEAGTDILLKAEILSYSRSKGLFAGISLNGAVLNIDQKANTVFYRKLVGHRKILFDGKMARPVEVKPLHNLLKPYESK